MQPLQQHNFFLVQSKLEPNVGPLDSKSRLSKLSTGQETL